MKVGQNYNLFFKRTLGVVTKRPLVDHYSAKSFMVVRKENNGKLPTPYETVT